MYNNQFEVTRGKQFFRDGEIWFPRGDKVKFDRRYRTCFGPAVAHSGVIYAVSDHNVRLAMRRLTKKREPDITGFHEFLFGSQSHYMECYGDFVGKLAALYYPHFADFTDYLTEAREHHADPHPKKALRVEAYRNLVDTGAMWTWEVWILKAVTGKMKPNEYAKPDKVGRMIGDFGTPASLLGFRAAEFLKEAQFIEPIHFLGGVMEFCKSPDPIKLAQIFEKLRDPPGRFYFVYFSDDSCLSVRVDGKVEMYNLDISSCDGSHGPSIWAAFQLLFPVRMRPCAAMLVKQCMYPFRVHSVSDMRNIVELTPKQPTLYSGATITTALNNFASCIFMSSIARLGDFSADGICFGAAVAGYSITVQRCETYHDLQFLKHSPVLDVTGRLVPLLNLGVLARLSGVCNGDLPGAGNLRERAACFQGALLNGAYPKAHFTLIDSMKVKYPLVRRLQEVDSMFEHKVVDDDHPPFYVLDSELYVRYRLTQLEIVELNTLFGSLGYGETLSTTGLDKIMRCDYQLSCESRLVDQVVVPEYWGVAS